MRLINITYADVEGYITYVLALVGTVCMGFFANYAEGKIDARTTNAFGDTIPGTSSLLWVIMTSSAALATFVAALALIVIFVREIVVPPLARFGKSLITKRDAKRHERWRRENPTDALIREIREKLPAEEKSLGLLED